ncbi:MAG: ferritin family protein [Candidatus Omnitrophica bacterium]|nr:ferritin family protein [Candidatus Omnitrophota bacterium]
MENKNPLEFSLNFEIKGANLYLKLAGKTKNQLSKHLFYTLAKQEIEHAQRFDEIYRSMIEQPHVKKMQLKAKNSDEVKNQLKEFFIKSEKTYLKQKSGDVSEYNLAMEMEEKSIKTYNDFLKQAGNEAEKEFFQQLINEEKQHLEALRNTCFYLTSSGDWFEKEESKIWNWMNI